MRWTSFRGAPLALFVLFAVGCGGGGSTPTGFVEVRVDWPARGRYVPPYADSIVAKITVGTTEHQVTLNRSGDQGYFDVVRFTPAFPVGTYILQGDAFTGSNGTGTKVASGSRQVIVQKGQTTTTPVAGDLQSTIDHLEIDAQPLSLGVDQQLQLAGHAEDSNNALLLLPSSALIWSISGANPPGTVTAAGLFSGVSRGTASIQLSEVGAQKQVTANVKVNTKIAFISDRNGNYELYVMYEDGSGLTNLTNNSASEFWPTWSPDRSKFAFMTNRDGNYEIYSIGVDGSNPTNLTNNGDWAAEPSWSPDGTKIIFSSQRNDDFEIYSMNANGADVTNLTNNAAFDFASAWSPDGTKIAFTTNRDSGNEEIYVMNASGSSPTRLTTGSNADRWPCWSPDGAKIAFTSNRDGHWEVYVMNSNGTGQVRLTTGSANNSRPAWSFDGLSIAFTSERDGNEEVYAMAPDGSNQTRLTNNGASDGHAVWRP